MAQLARVYHKVFGNAGTSDNFAKFGSAAAGAVVTTKDITTIMALPAWDTGWQDAVVGGNKAPLLEEMNAHMFVHSSQIGYLFQTGIPEFDLSTTYYAGSVVRVGEYWYRSLTDNNVGNPPPAAASDANWVWENQKSALPGDSIPWNGLDVRPGCLWEDGQAYDRATYPALFAAITSTRNGTLTNGSPVITGIGTTARLGPGMAVEGAGIQAGSVILTVDSPARVTLDKGAVASLTTALIFAPFGLPNGTQFNVPDSRGRGLISPDNMGVGPANRVVDVIADVLGGAAGSENILLTAAQSGLPAHTHQAELCKTNYNVGSGGGFYANSGLTLYATAANVSAPAAQAHNNMGPYRTVNWCIKY